MGDNCKVREGSGTGEDRVPRGLALDEERLDRAGPGHLQAAREVPQSPGERGFIRFFLSTVRVRNFKSEPTGLEISSSSVYDIRYDEAFLKEKINSFSFMF